MHQCNVVNIGHLVSAFDSVGSGWGAADETWGLSVSMLRADETWELLHDRHQGRFGISATL
eukprot:2577343-Pleurochrysis_carterae.AAC.4